MKNFLKLTFSLLFILLTAFTITSCRGGEDEDEKVTPTVTESDKNRVVGEYVFVNTTINGITFPSPQSVEESKRTKKYFLRINRGDTAKGDGSISYNFLHKPDSFFTFNFEEGDAYWEMIDKDTIQVYDLDGTKGIKIKIKDLSSSGVLSLDFMFSDTSTLVSAKFLKY